MNAFSIIRTIILIAEAVLAVALIITIFMQPANTTGMGAIDNTETYYTKHKKKSTEGIMKMATTIIAITMAVLAVVFFVLLCIYKAGV